MSEQAIVRMRSRDNSSSFPQQSGQHESLPEWLSARSRCTNGGLIHTTIAQESDMALKARYQARYNWLKNQWFGAAPSSISTPPRPRGGGIRSVYRVGVVNARASAPTISQLRVSVSPWPVARSLRGADRCL